MNIKRLVIKIGTSTIVEGKSIYNTDRMKNIINVIANLKKEKKEVVLVTSGAIGIGTKKIGLSKMPKEIFMRQACASLGQSDLINFYSSLFLRHGCVVAQILLEQSFFNDVNVRNNVKKTFDELLKREIIPIVNFNDAVLSTNLEYKDNDFLASMVSCLIETDVLVLLTDLDGVYDKNPNLNADAKLITKIEKIDDDIQNSVKGDSSFFGTGGMEAKLKAAEFISTKKIPTVILNGSYPDRIYGIFDDKIDGTLIDLKTF